MVNNISEAELTYGRILVQAAEFPRTYHIRGDKVVTEFGTNKILLATTDPVDATTLSWLINHGEALIAELEERRRKDAQVKDLNVELHGE